MSELLHPLYIAVMGTRYFSCLIVIVAVLFSGCKASRPASVFEQLMVEEVVEAEVREFSSQKAYPGVESNLRYTEHFIVVWKATFNEPVEVVALLADSTRMPISFLKIDDERQKAPFPTLYGSVAQIECRASRNVYNQPELDDASSNLGDRLSPTLSPNEYYLECRSENGIYWVPLPALVRLESIYAP